ncbi:PREDICTED: uncharacterized protein LOC104611759 [Nelumbo nucifera]|uniref:Uncharacterized protein LOC104611759 n=2 Tax=Nelumbo nucifera TaxID=4432 RepID=A0A1U8BBT8_NELNU|nr:PREDICTED: uncharacterized protein LOC104611759 [Nelumbo nucifera]DAD46005.1 TPA_asm: hypothetical protein HUJ06_004235 [Nelumbo nucifera]
MADSTATTESRCHVRSISMPSRSHPTATNIEEELNRLRALESLSSTAQSGSPLKEESISVALFGLVELYKCVESFLQMPQTQQIMVQHQLEALVDELIEGPVTLLDIGGTTKDILLQMKENVLDLHSALRRRKFEEMLGNKVGTYISFKKRVKKDVSSCLKMLKRLEEKCVVCPLLDLDHDSAMVVRVLREVNSVAISVFRAILSFLSTPMSKPKVGRWHLVSKLMHRGVVACDRHEESMNEVESVDVVLFALTRCNPSKDAEVESSQMVEKRLKDLEDSVESLEEGLNFLFRRLIQTRVSLLNILTN